MISKLFRGFVEGLGSKSLASVISAIVSVLLVALLNKKLGVNLSETEFFTIIGSIVGIVLTYLFKQWHLDVKTDGKTTTQALLIDRAAKELAKSLPDHTMLAKIAKLVDSAIPDDATGPQTPPVQK